jgi:hypothetical protein
MLDPRLSDADDWTDDQLADCARAAFLLGLADGRQRSKPRRRDEVVEIARLAYQRRKIHAAKIRQVYGAGFDLSNLLVQVQRNKERFDGKAGVDTKGGA